MTAKVDPKGEYIKTWMPEFKNVEARDLSKWDDKRIREKYALEEYPKEPIVNHAERRLKALDMFKS
jgi:deoxyribodipyrimidine photo-lyase